MTRSKPARRRAPYQPKPPRPYAEGRAHKQGRNRVAAEPLVVVAVRVTEADADWLAARAGSRSEAVRQLVDAARAAEQGSAA